MKNWVKVLLGSAIVFLGILVFILMLKNGRKPQQEEVNKPRRVSTRLVVPGNLPFVIEATGSLMAKRKIELYSEVQGVLIATAKEFKAGNEFYKNQTILQVNSAEFEAQLLASRSSFLNKIASMLPDMEVEFAQSSQNWQSYLQEFKVYSSLGNLPKPMSESERLFLTGRGIYENFYTVKNQEERLSKYTLKAPFNGVVTESLVNEGTLVRSGQKLGEFIDTSLFEIKLEVPAQYGNYIEVGKEVTLRTLDNGQEHQGKISRVNAKIDLDTQTMTVVVEISGKTLKEGQFLKGIIFGETIENVVKINNNLLVENNQVYVVKDSMLQLQPVTPINYLGDSVVVRGLKSNTLLIDKVLANAYPGMKVVF
ncbi:MAG: HlyD family efflux transporter periplasmic adaptor subunit [Bacteroidota bacterium]